MKNLGLIKDRINDIAKTDLSKIKAGGADAGSGGGSGSDGTVKQNDVKAIRDYNKEVGKQNAFFGQNRSERRALQAQLQTELKLKKDLGKAIDQEIVALKKQKQAHSQTTKAISEAQRIYEKFQTGQRISSLEMEQLTSISQKYGKSTFELADALEQSGKKYTQAQESLKRLGNRYTKTADEVKNLETQIAALNKTQSAIVGFGKSVASTVGWTLLITAILTALGALWKWISNLKTAAKQQREFNKAIKEGTAQIASQGVVVLQELAYAYKKVGDNAEEKKKFIEQFKDKIAETGIAVNDVNTADNVFIKNTDKYVEALMARAKAQAIENKAIELYQEYLTKRAEIESKKGYEDDKKLANDLVKAGIMTQEEADMVGGKTQKKLNKLESEINGTLKRLFEDVANINSEWADF